MSKFVEVASNAHVISGTGALVNVAGTAVVLFNINGQIFAIDDVCMRCGWSLAAGKLHATLIRCSSCGWQYDVTTGCVMGVPALRIPTFEAKVADAAILVATTAMQTF